MKFLTTLIQLNTHKILNQNTKDYLIIDLVTLFYCHGINGLEMCPRVLLNYIKSLPISY